MYIINKKGIIILCILILICFCLGYSIPILCDIYFPSYINDHVDTYNNVTVKYFNEDGKIEIIKGNETIIIRR